MADLVLPFADLDGIFESVEYRSNLAQTFEALDIEGGVALKVVSVDDLRTIPQHQFRVKIQPEALQPHYDKHRQKLRFLVLARDTVLRHEVTLADHPIDGLPDIIDLSREKLRATSLRAELPLRFSIIAIDVLKGSAALPTQKASRLAKLEVNLKNSAGGGAFPFLRKSAEEFKSAGMPSEAGLYLDLVGDAAELVEKTDTPIENLLSIWVHEKVWQAIQSDHTSTTSNLRLAMVTITATQMLLGAAAPCLKAGGKVEEDSLVGQLLGYLEKQASLPSGQLRKRFEQEHSVHALDPYIQHAWRFVGSGGREEEEATA